MTAEPASSPTTSLTSTEETATTLGNSPPSLSAVTDVPPDEQGFLAAVANLPMYVIPGGRIPTDASVISSGYRACADLDQYPTDSMRAARAFYPGGNQVDGAITYDGQMFMLYAANYLCRRHAHLYENF